MVLGAVALAVVWFYLWMPWRNVNDREWRAEHTPYAFWKDEMRWWDRTGSIPRIWIGFHGLAANWGKRAEFERVLEFAKDFDGCPDCSMIDHGLEMPSNHSFPSDQEWRAWFEDHKHESQEEWIRQGFAKVGIQVSIPPDKHEVEPLLSALGRKPEGPEREYGSQSLRFIQPPWIRFNAYRWLLDSGFDPVEYLLAKNGERLPVDTVLGIQAFQELVKWSPQPGRIAQLSFAVPTKDVWDFGFSPLEPTFATASFQWAVHSLIVVLLTNGIYFIRRGWRSRRGDLSLIMPAASQES